MLNRFRPTFSRVVNSSYLKCSVAPVSDVPFTMACWASRISNARHGFMSLSTEGSNNERLSLGTNFGLAMVVARTTTEAVTQVASPSVALGFWAHYAGVFISSTNRWIYFNGSGTQGTGSRSPTGMNQLLIGAESTTSTGANASIVYPAVWNAALSANEIALLAAGAHPTTVRPESLVAFWDFVGTTTEYSSFGSSVYALESQSTLVGTAPAFNRMQIVSRKSFFGQPSIATGNRRRRLLTGVNF